MKIADLFLIPNHQPGFLYLPHLLAPKHMHGRSGCVSSRRPTLRHHRQLRWLPTPKVLSWGRRFGEGTVTEMSGEGDNRKIGVSFEHVGQKHLLLKFAKFTILK